MLVLWAGICGAQTPRSPTGPADYVEIKLPPSVPSERVFIRYILTGQEFFGWVQPRAGVSSYLISRLHNGRPAAAFRAIIYAPGCAIRTVVLTPSNSEGPSYSFDCRPLPDIAIAGTLRRPDPLYGRDFKVQAKYIARWAPAFFGLEDNFSIGIPIGEAAEVTAGEPFRLLVPDLSQDPLAGTQDHPGTIQVWATARRNNRVSGEPDLSGHQILLARSCDELLSLPIRPEYPEITFTPCFSGYLHDENGFAIRPYRNDPPQH